MVLPSHIGLLLEADATGRPLTLIEPFAVVVPTHPVTVSSY